MHITCSYFYYCCCVVCPAPQIRLTTWPADISSPAANNGSKSLYPWAKKKKKRAALSTSLRLLMLLSGIHPPPIHHRGSPTTATTLDKPPKILTGQSHDEPLLSKAAEYNDQYEMSDDRTPELQTGCHLRYLILKEQKLKGKTKQKSLHKYITHGRRHNFEVSDASGPVIDSCSDPQLDERPPSPARSLLPR